MTADAAAEDAIAAAASGSHTLDADPAPPAPATLSPAAPPPSRFSVPCEPAYGVAPDASLASPPIADDVAAESAGAAAAASPDMFGNVAAVDSQGAAPRHVDTISFVFHAQVGIWFGHTASLASPPMADAAAEAAAVAAATSPPRRAERHLCQQLANCFRLDTRLLGRP